MTSLRKVPLLKTAPALLAALVAVLMLLGVSAAGVTAKSMKKKGSVAKKLPAVVRIDPMDVEIGDTLSITGKNIVKGKNKVLVMFQKKGSKRRFTARGAGQNSSTLTVTVPDVSGDLTQGQSNIFRIRLITKFGVSAKWSSDTNSPNIKAKPGQAVGAADCDKDGVLDTADADDDNDLLSDAQEVAIGTDRCEPDTDGDTPTDYYEFRVAYEYNGGPVLPYPGRRPYPNPLFADSSVDHDGDQMSARQEFEAWMYTGRMDRFYSDANQDSDLDTVFDDEEDEDGDLLPNMAEVLIFGGDTGSLGPIDWLRWDSDGDGLCDGLDDIDHDGPATPVAAGDCVSAVPNNLSPGDPNGALTDGDDNIYSNWYEWFFNTGPFNPCTPSAYPTSPFCPHP